MSDTDFRYSVMAWKPWFEKPCLTEYCFDDAHRDMVVHNLKQLGYRVTVDDLKEIKTEVDL